MKHLFRLLLALLGIAALFAVLSVCGLEDEENKCSDCGGTGSVDGDPCPTCSIYGGGTLPLITSEDVEEEDKEEQK